MKKSTKRPAKKRAEKPATPAAEKAARWRRTHATVNGSIPDDTHQRVKAAMAKHDLSQSMLVRKAVEAYLADLDRGEPLESPAPLASSQEMSADASPATVPTPEARPDAVPTPEGPPADTGDRRTVVIGVDPRGAAIAVRLSCDDSPHEAIGGWQWHTEAERAAVSNDIWAWCRVHVAVHPDAPVALVTTSGLPGFPDPDFWRGLARSRGLHWLRPYNSVPAPQDPLRWGPVNHADPRMRVAARLACAARGYVSTGIDASPSKHQHAVEDAVPVEPEPRAPALWDSIETQLAADLMRLLPAFIGRSDIEIRIRPRTRSRADVRLPGEAQAHP